MKRVALLMIILIATLPLVHAETISLTYDANGNLVTDGTTYREYNSLNQLIRVRNGSNSTEPIMEEYVHHPTEERIYMTKTYYGNNNNSVRETVIYYTPTFVKVKNSSGSYKYTYVKHEGQL